MAQANIRARRFSPARERAGGKAPSQTHVLPRDVQVFWYLYLAALVASVLIAIAMRQMGLPQTRWNPLSDPLMGDLMEYPGTFQLLHTAAFFDNALPGGLPKPMFSAVAYPPFASVLLAPLYLTAHPALLFLSAALVWLAGALWWVYSAFIRTGVARATAILLPLTLTITAFPVLRLIHQGNIELLVWVLTATGTYSFVRRHHSVAAGLWGLAAAVKFYPLLLLLPLVPQQRYRALLFGCSIFLISSWLALWWLGPTTAIAFNGSFHNVFGYQQLRTAEWSLRELVANHSAFSFVKLGAQMFHLSSSRLALPYYISGGLLFFGVFLVRLAKMPVANQLLGVTVAMLLLPTVSYYHTLVHLYAPLLLLLFVALQAHQAGLQVAGLRTSLSLFIPLFVPYTLCTFPHVFLFCGLVQSCALGLLFLCALQYPFHCFAAIRQAGPLDLSAERWPRPALRHPARAVRGIR